MTAAADDPRCGGCGYRVAGLPTAVCPECGSDLTVVGIVHGRRQLSKWRRRALRIGGWTAALLFVLCTFRATEDWLPLPRVTVRQRFITFFPGDGGQGLFATVSVSQTVRELRTGNDGGSRPLGEVILSLSNSADLSGNARPGPSDLHVDWPTKSYHYSAGGRTVRHDGGFGPSTVLAWLADNGVRPSDGVRPPTTSTATVAALQASHLIDDVDQMSRPLPGPFTSPGSFFPTNVGPVLTESHPVRGFDRGVDIGAAFTWVLGVWFLWRRPVHRSR